MKIIKFLALLSFLLVLFSPISGIAQDEVQEHEAPSAEHLEKVNQFILHTVNQTQRLRLILAALVQKSDADSVKNINRQFLQNWALTIQQFLKDISDMQVQSVRNVTVKACVNQYCANLISQAIEQELKTLPDFAPETALHKNTPQGISLTELLSMQNATEEQLVDLEYKVKNLGLSSINKIARHLEALCKHHRVTTWLPWIGAAAVLAYGTYWYQNPMPTLVTLDNKDFLVTNRERAHKWLDTLLNNGIGTGIALLTQKAFHENAYTLGGMWETAKIGRDRAWNYVKGVPTALDMNGYQMMDSNTITFESDELIGQEEQIHQVAPILACCSDMQHYISLGNKPQYGTLLIGPSGCGKTFFARALAGTISQTLQLGGHTSQVKFKEISCVDLAISNLRTIIAEARKEGGVVVLFIDEIHNLSMQTNKNSFTLNDFLTQMADLYNSDDPNSHVFLIAATNQPELLGASLLVPGRFGKIIRFSYPNIAKRTELFNKLLPRAGINPEEVNIASLVRQTDGFVSYGKLRSLINEARIKAESRGEIVAQTHLQETIDTMVHRFTHTLELSSQEKRVIAVYQASKTLMHFLLETSSQVERVTIGGINPEVKELNEYNGAADKPNPNKSDLYRPQFGAVITCASNEMLKSGTMYDYEKECKCLVAGLCGQDLLLNTHNPQYCSDDIGQAIIRTQEIVLDGKQFEDLSTQRKNEIKDAAEQLFEKYKQEVHMLLEKHTNELESLVKLLEEKITISGEEARAVIVQTNRNALISNN